ncbi:hypothetical protein O0I10_000955 [Lichtheimia ornata]|uniref:Uncharacterized protein n=1 Tax=Lichtheimia ornata TaxID=688661 RepID=A0AAD8DJ18_9FUNG|nr:uncharacterized protein O0I10_000955 [Lichtheimia ornata]KAJ8663706.1 hypothetical protein O0I10_000955 [Lichtheimia ornata]
MLQICVTPGPRTVDAISFLEPVLEELESIATDGFHVQVGSSMLRVKAHLLCGDMPAASKMAGLIVILDITDAVFVTLKENTMAVQ